MKKHKSKMVCTASTNPAVFTVGRLYDAVGNATEGGHVKCDFGFEYGVTPTHTMTQSLYIHTLGNEQYIFQIRG